MFIALKRADSARGVGIGSREGNHGPAEGPDLCRLEIVAAFDSKGLRMILIASLAIRKP
jgi:hypothetical protein